VHVTAGGVKVETVSPFAFVRPDGMRRLPLPEIPCSDEEARVALDAFWSFMQLDRGGSVAAFAWLMAAMCPMQYARTRDFRRFPILALVGSQARGKSSKADALRLIIDPRNPAHADLPATPKDLAIVGVNQRALSFDNLSSISPVMADALCRRATGDGLEVRGLYTDRGMKVFSGSNPVIVNAIEDAIFERADLLSRTILLDVPAGDRVTDEEVAARFDALRGRVFGALCHCLSRAVRDAHEVTPHVEIRMSSAAAWAVAAGRAVGISEAEVIAAYLASARRGEAIVLDRELPEMLLRFLQPGQKWRGSSEELRSALTAAWAHSHGGDAPPRDWPNNARALRGALARLEPALSREVGVAPAVSPGGNLDEMIRISKAAFAAGDTTRGVKLLREIFQSAKDRADVDIVPQARQLLDAEER
jgi:hypothetical protein